VRCFAGMQHTTFSRQAGITGHSAHVNRTAMVTRVFPQSGQRRGTPPLGEAPHNWWLVAVALLFLTRMDDTGDDRGSALGLGIQELD
jgi:hypothetical protein